MGLYRPGSVKQERQAGILALTPSYIGASKGRRMGTWNPGSEGPNAIVANWDIDMLRRRSHDAIRNTAVGEAWMRTTLANLVGNGIVPIPKVESDDLRARIMELWDQHVEEMDADNVLNGYGLQALATRSWKESGDAFVRIRYRNDESGLAVPVQYQVLEAEMVDATRNEMRRNGNRIIGGVELNRFGERVAYWMYKEHPGNAAYLGSSSSAERIRVPARQVIHVFHPIRPGQVRGIPALAPVLATLLELEKYDDAEVLRKQIVSMLVGFVTKPQVEDNPIGSGSAGIADDSVPLATLEPGTMQELLPGEDVRFTQPPVDNLYEAFNRAQLRKFASGSGVTFEQLTGDMTQVNYSSIRAGLVEFRRQIEQVRNHIVVFQLCRPMWKLFIRQAVLSGSLALPKGITTVRAAWRATPGFAYVDPEKEVKAAIREIRAGLKTRTDSVAERGYDAVDLDREYKRDIERQDELGLTYDTDARGGSAPGMSSLEMGTAGKSTYQEDEASEEEAA